MVEKFEITQDDKFQGGGQDVRCRDLIGSLRARNGEEIGTSMRDWRRI